MHAQTMQKFMFDRDFDDLEILREIVEQEVLEQEPAVGEPESPPVPVAPTFSQEELTEARKQAHELGKREGIAETLAGIEQQITISLDKITTEVTSLLAAQTSSNDAIARDTAHLALAVARKLFPRLHEIHGLGEIVAVTEDILSHLIREPRLVVSVSEKHADAMRTRLADFLAKRGFTGNLELRGEAAIGAGDCKIEWMGGNAARSTAALFAEIESIVDRHVGTMTMDDASEKSDRPMQD